MDVFSSKKSAFCSSKVVNLLAMLWTDFRTSRGRLNRFLYVKLFELFHTLKYGLYHADCIYGAFPIPVT